ncbi:acyl-CoA dehydrogenase family protein [Pseudonocardia sp.]|uniref:acyl-CoA dehydrogenase family protein n=1 Tax=Pseudonocardia sp. TaxID=60912 RepID=UPI0026299295|nr:acyl-CoA dehydrogenase family protein [Pseudonocardia sp.]
MAEHEEYGSAVDEYLTRAYDGDRRTACLTAGGWDAGLAAELAGLGWNGLAVPERHGGLGAPLSALGPVLTALGRHLVVGPMLENTLLPAVLHPLWASAPALAAAVETGVPVALVDPGVTDDRAAAVGTVTLRDQRLSGAVEAVRFAGQASLLAVVAATEAGEVVCLVDPAAAGVRVDGVDSADPAAAFGRVALDDVRADAATPADGGELVARIRSWARLLLACELSGVADHALDRTVTHIGQREQFGQPIGSFQAVKHIAADMYAQATSLRNLCAAALADSADAGTADLDVLAWTAKAHAAQVAVRVCEDAVQLHGGMGFTTESDVSACYLRALALRGWYGDATELQLRIGAALLDRA